MQLELSTAQLGIWREILLGESEGNIQVCSPVGLVSLRWSSVLVEFQNGNWAKFTLAGSCTMRAVGMQSPPVALPEREGHARSLRGRN